MAKRKKIELPESDDALMDQCDMQTFRSSGPGGQHVNTADSAVRLKHRPTGIVVTSREHRSQHRNREECLRKLRERVKKLNHRPKRRKPTRKSRGVRERELKRKRIRSEKKRLRRRPSAD